MFKSGYVSLVGRTNVGKSTLLNALTGEKVAIATNKPQTTRTAIKAILNSDDYQIIITDTPGIHKPKTKLSEAMLDTSYKMLNDSDVVLFLVEVEKIKNINDLEDEALINRIVGPGDKLIVERLNQIKKPVILVINKIDLISKEELIKFIKAYSSMYDFKAVVPVSSEKKKGLDDLIKEVLNYLPEGPKYYQDDEYTDQTVRSLSEEIIREKLLKFLQDEVPHGLYVEISKFQERKTTKGEDIYDVEATINCLKESHKGIIIGKGGTLLKKIGTYARQDIEDMLGTRVNLKLWVKVKENWQDNQALINDKFKLK
jgi:GTP-binding protein Era